MYLTKIIQPLVGQIAWNIKHSTGSMISIEFGEPTIMTRKTVTPSTISKSSNPSYAKNDNSKHVKQKGQHSLLFLECGWVLEQTGSKVVDSNFSTNLIRESIENLHGQKVNKIGCKIGASVQFQFIFNLGSRLITRSFHGSDAQFDFFDNTQNKILTARGDGMFAYGDYELEENEMIWESPKDVPIDDSVYTIIQ